MKTDRKGALGPWERAWRRAHGAAQGRMKLRAAIIERVWIAQKVDMAVQETIGGGRTGVVEVD